MFHFFGDSNTACVEGIPPSFYLPADTALHAVPGATVAVDVPQQIQAATATPGDVAIIQGGVNDLYNASSPGDVASDLEFCRATALANGFSVAYVLPIYPHLNQQPKIEQVNSILNHDFAELYDLLVADDGMSLRPLYDKSDGLHLSPAGSRVVAKEVAKVGGLYYEHDWAFAGLPVELDIDSPTHLGRRWIVGPKPISGNPAGSDGYTGAFAAFQGSTPANFHATALIRLQRDEDAFFAFKFGGHEHEAIFAGHNYRGNMKSQADHWIKLTPYEQIGAAFDTAVNQYQQEITASFYDLDFDVIRFNGKIWAAVGDSMVVEGALVPPGMPQDDLLGFWGRMFSVLSFQVQPVSCVPVL